MYHVIESKGACVTALADHMRLFTKGKQEVLHLPAVACHWRTTASSLAPLSSMQGRLAFCHLRLLTQPKSCGRNGPEVQSASPSSGLEGARTLYLMRHNTTPASSLDADDRMSLPL